MSQHPTRQDKTAVELTEQELKVLLTHYRQRFKQRLKLLHPNVAADYALRMRIMTEAIDKLEKERLAERQRIAEQVKGFPRSVG